MRDLNTQPIGDARTNAVARRRHEAQLMDRQAAHIALELGEDIPSTSDIAATAAGDPEKLRGIPAIGGRGSLGGAIRGTRP